MTTRIFKPALSIDYTGTPAQKDALHDKAFIESADGGAAREKSPATADVPSKEKTDISSAEDAADIVASCEDKDATQALDAGKVPAPLTKKKVVTPPSALQAAIDQCIAVRSQHGSFIGWGERSEATASASLALTALMNKDHAALKFVRKKLNEERKSRDERALNKATSNELLAVFMCAPPKTKADRQECSRFANVIAVALKEKRTPENVGAWLKMTSLTDALEKAQAAKGKQSNKNYSVAITRTKFPAIWANFKTKEVREAIEKALKSVDNSLKKAASNAR